MKIGDPLDRSTDHGPQNHKAHLDKLVEYCEKGVKEGARLVCGGKQVNRPGEGSVWAFALVLVGKKCKVAYAFHLYRFLLWTNCFQWRAGSHVYCCWGVLWAHHDHLQIQWVGRNKLLLPLKCWLSHTSQSI